MSEPFAFLEPGVLIDDDLSLVLTRKNPADTPVKGFVPSYDFEMRSAIDPSRVAGKVNFRAVDLEPLRLYGGHFGYGVAQEFRGRHYAERRFDFSSRWRSAHGFRQVWITCNPENWPSRRTCEHLGGVLVEIVALPPDTDMYKEGTRFKCRYCIDL